MAKRKWKKVNMPNWREYGVQIGPGKKPASKPDPDFERAMAEQFDRYADSAAAESTAAPPHEKRRKR